MAKMKVHELAKELQKQSKEILAFLQEQGIEAKAPQSTLEEDTVALVRKSFGADTGKTEEKKAAPVKEENAKAQTAPARDQGTEEAPKKKKKIIIVSNNNGSNNFSSQRPGNNRPGQGGNGRQGNNGGNRQNRPAQETHHRIIKPLTAPSMPDTMKPDFKQNARRMEEERNAARNQARREAEAAAAESAQRRPAPSQNQGQRQTPNQNQQSREQAPARQQGREERYQRNERSQEQRPQRNDGRGSFSGNRPNNAGGRNDFRRDGAPSNGSRPSGSNGRPERSNGGQDNRFKKPERQGKGFMADTPIKDAEKHRDEEKRRNSQERDKKSKKDFMYEEDETALKNKNKAGRFIKPEKKQEEPEEQIKVITLPESLTIKDLADKMKLQPSAIIKKLFLQGQIVTVNTEISYEEAENIAIDYDIICEQEVKVDVIEELLKEDEEKEEDLERRPPVICVMGHVDHGKTSLLDAIRKTNVTDKEAGGITQHIGAYTVNVKGQSITFLDTPGHEAFTAMRMRGANSTDIAILVVAADDGVMPQTVEAINHAKAAGIEIIVAVNKIDKPGANIDKVKQEMTEYELIPVDWGGSTEFVPVSAKSGEGIDTLLETILLTAEIMELKANPHRRARGLVIEAELDKGRGPVATVLVQKGTLHVGDFISAGATHGKVRAMVDDKGRRVKEALPSTPVEILGLSDVPSAGEVFIAHESDKVAKSYAETYLAQNKVKKLEETKAKMSLDDLFSQIQAGNLKELNIIVKADVQGSVEAVKQSLMKLSNEEVVVKCIHGGVGAINESDVSLASASSAIIIGFNVRPDAMAKTIAEREGVDIRLYRVIYQAIEDIEAAMKGMLDPVYEEKVIGHAEVRQIFKASAVGNIAGSYVLDGEFRRDCKVRITREGEQIYEGELKSLKRFKDDVKEVKAGFECGLVFEGFDQMQELDIVEAYIMVEVPR
ncbi:MULTISPECIES: translation initiation factor IF-2 [Suilimivivens]|uniref:Translation initiation factor IF-2 n=2 Tax=Suilimivivens TaxID=2981640 RepID=A0ABT2T166_9FIRM|nr:translation initiation factor IF-2 [Suilimivivens aceti]MCU6744010.1 translation initiation factor IF-2 [Suilimivivens aceti]SCH51197.1 Translation initiation factor IF-2 [uncultured Clostridium sp.]